MDNPDKVNNLWALTDLEFVELWCKTYKQRIGLKQMCEYECLDYIATSRRANQLRNVGVKLPTMPKADQRSNTLESNIKMLNHTIVTELGPEALSWRNR